MSKHLKLDIKNAQLAEALKINKLKSTAAEAKKKLAKDEEEKKPLSKPLVKKVDQEPKKVEHHQEIKAPKKAIATKTESPSTPNAASEPIKKPPEVKKEKIQEASPTKGKLEEKKALEQDKKTLAWAPREFRDIKSTKRTEQKTFDARDRLGLRDTEEGAWRKRRQKGKVKRDISEEVVRPKHLKIRLPITVKDLSQAMKLKASDVIAKLFLQGVAITINDYLDDETTVQLLGHEFGCEIEVDKTEEERLRITGKTIVEEISETPAENLKPRCPVIAFMGHVDHGKTSLIDAIRKSDRVSQEAGAITQHIGAFKCHTPRGEITILDTPGHEAFSEMRERGASVTDIVILVIAGDEGMKPQTEEAMQKALEAKVPILVAINKSDKPGFDPENIYRQLSDHNLLPEAWGGSTITVNCSALTGKGIPELLEMILLQAEVLELKADPSYRARGTVLESELHKGLGITATLLVQNGSLKIGDAVVIEEIYGRIKTMHDEHGKILTIASPSTPVKITGLSDLPEAGSEFIVVKSEKEAKELTEKRVHDKSREIAQVKKGVDLLKERAERKEKKILNLIIKADVQGSLEAIKNSLQKIPSDKVELNIISSGIGEISESDIDLATISEATIVGFHTKVEAHAEPINKQKKIPILLHDVIYHLIDDVKKSMAALLDKIREEKHVGTALVKATFKASHLGVIAGCIVQEGSIHRSHFVKLFRNEEKVWEGSIASLKRVKEDVREVVKGLECGIVLSHFNDIKEGDLIQSYEIQFKEQSL